MTDTAERDKHVKEFRDSLIEEKREDFDALIDWFEEDETNSVAELIEERDDLKADVESMDSLLLDIREWFDRVTVYKRPMSDPRPIIRKLEDAIRI